MTPRQTVGPLGDESVADVEEALRHWLPGQRWFGGKDRPIEAVHLLSDTPVTEPDAQPELHHLVVAVVQPGGRHVYQVPVSLRREADDRLEHARIGETAGQIVHDALHDKEATAALLSCFGEGRVGTLEFRVEPGATVPYGEASIVLSAEQSNTSLVFGEAAILKVFRHLSPGRNPDIEVHDALTRAECPYVADLLGWIDGQWPVPQPDGGEDRAVGSMAMLQRFLVTATDGWELAKASVRDLFAEGDLHADEVGGDFAAEARRLGAATAEVHLAMRATLPTGTLDNDDLRARAAAMRGRLQGALEVVPDLRPFARGLFRAFDDLGALDGPVPVQRVHGDYHLGQVLRTVLGWKLLDFEGEPAKPLAERVALDSPLRDVAGMLRSFDYAARHMLADHPGDTQLAYRAAEWAERNRDAFCDGYADAAGRDPREDAVLLRAYETDKAIYEAVYEARNRPAWLGIPLAAVERLAS